MKGVIVLKRRDFLNLFASLTAAGVLRGAPARRPNILLIVADDLGYGELSSQGCRDVSTPNIDSLAHNGVRFTSGYVSCPVCSPSRAGLMTGRYQQRFGYEFNPGPGDRAIPDFGLPLNEVSIAERMKQLGYATGVFGKWHLGYNPPYHPLKRGFDEFFGFLGGSHSYVDALGDKVNPVFRGTQPIDEKSYLTEAFAREACSFIERHRANPFFVYLPFNAVHDPLEALNKYRARFASIADEKRRTFAAMQSAMDDAVGRVLATLRAHRLEDDTLIIFISDNGGPTSLTTSGNSPLRGFKRQVWEGGIRVPFMMQWKGRIPSGKVYARPVISLDISPTVMAAAGSRIPADAALDGVDLMPFLAGREKGDPHTHLFWRFGALCAVRAGDWKLLRRAVDAPWELYNLAADISEKSDIAAAQPEKVKELGAAFSRWNSQLAEPRWREGGGAYVGTPKKK